MMFGDITRSVWDRICSMKHPLLFLLIVGILIRLTITAFIVQYDADYWARVIRNLRVDEGLYNMEGFYYTPVWGYILSFIGVIQSMFLDLGEYGVRVTEAIIVEYVPGFFMSANIPSLMFNYSVRIPLIISDILLSYTVYWLIRDMGYGDRKALFAFLLTFMSVHLAGCTCMTGMPDTFTALFMILCIIFLRRDSNLLAGAMFALSALTKFFPVFLIFILCAYILKKNRDDLGKCIKELSKAIVGAATVSVVVYLPIIMEGHAIRSFAFILDRTSGIISMVSDHWLMIIAVGSAVILALVILLWMRVRNGRYAFNVNNLGIMLVFIPTMAFVGGMALSGMDGLLGSSRIALYAAAILLGLILAICMYRSSNLDVDRFLIWSCALTIGFCMLYPPAPQYVVTLIPLLACYLAINGKSATSWIILMVAGAFFIPVTNGLMLMTLAQWTDLISVNTAMGIFEAYQSSIFGTTVMNLQYILSGGLQYIGLVLVAIVLLKDRSYSKEVFIHFKNRKNRAE